MATLIRTLRAGYDDGHEVGDHDHGWGQLVYASGGAIHVTAAGQAWLIPPARAVWLPPGTRHRLRMRGATTLRTLYIPPGRCAGLAAVPLGLAVSPLLRELILQLVQIGHVDATDAFHRALGDALIATLARAERLALALTLPSDRRALRVAEAILADPAGGGALGDLTAGCGASLRTVQRKFIEQTGLPLSAWRQAARLIAATGLLLDGSSVTQTALQAGYSGPSAFTHAFRSKIGQTPSAFRLHRRPAGSARSRS